MVDWVSVMGRVRVRLCMYRTQQPSAIPVAVWNRWRGTLVCAPPFRSGVHGSASGGTFTSLKRTKHTRHGNRESTKKCSILLVRVLFFVFFCFTDDERVPTLIHLDNVKKKKCADQLSKS